MFLYRNPPHRRQLAWQVHWVVKQLLCSCAACHGQAIRLAIPRALFVPVLAHAFEPSLDMVGLSGTMIVV
jgi:hypothetical protein